MSYILKYPEHMHHFLTEHQMYDLTLNLQNEDKREREGSCHYEETQPRVNNYCDWEQCIVDD